MAVDFHSCCTSVYKLSQARHHYRRRQSKISRKPESRELDRLVAETKLVQAHTDLQGAKLRIIYAKQFAAEHAPPDTGPAPPSSPPVAIDEFFKVKRVLKKERDPKTKRLKFLVKFTGYDDCENMWLPCNQFTPDMRKIASAIDAHHSARY